MRLTILFLILLTVLCSLGCVATTNFVVNHKPLDNLSYTVTQEWKHSY
jgi:hypothetical protein